MPTESSHQKLHLWSGLIVLGVFLAGAGTGAGIVSWMRPPHHPPARHHMPGGPGRFLRELNLTPEQHAQVKPILDKHRRQIEEAMKETFPKIRAVDEQTEKELRALLTDEQKKNFDEIKARRPPMGSPPGGPPPMGGPPPARSGEPGGELPPPPGPRPPPSH